MKLSKFFPNGKPIRLRATTRDGAIRELVGHLVTTGSLPTVRAEAAVQALLTREHAGSTAIGKLLAVPHARLQFPCELVTCCGIAPHGIDWSGTSVKVVFILLSSISATAQHLHVLAQVSTLVRNSAWFDGLLDEHDVDMT